MAIAANKSFGHYHVLAPLGAGGMGEVWRARDTRLNRQVAIKVLPDSFTNDAERLRRFEQEAKAASALNHPNIITIYEIGETATEGGDIHFMATELIEGQTVRQQIACERLKLGSALDVATQVASALAAAHAAGIVHRDIKPENVMARPDGLVKVLDFGLAKLTERRPPAFDTDGPTAINVKTEPGVVVGTTQYMSPEQARGVEADARTDIFSLGVMLYEMIAGRLPFEGKTPTDVLVSILEKEPAPLSRHAPEVPAELQRIISKALRKDREERYQGVKDLLLDLKSLKEELIYEAKSRAAREPETADGAMGATSLNQGLETAKVMGAPSAEISPARTTSSAEYLVSKARHYLRRALPALTALVLSGGILAYFVLRLSLPPNVTASTQITWDGLPKGGSSGALFIDGSRLYFSERASEQWGIAQVSVTGGETVAIHAPPFRVKDLSPNRSEFLVLSNIIGTELESRLWVLPVLSDVPRRVGDLMCHDATWSLDGQQIVYAYGSALYLAKSDGTESRMLVTVSGRAYWPRWSPDGSRLRFTVRNAERSSANPLFGNSLWEVSADGSNSHPLLPGWNEPANECCGNWTVDGRYFVFQSTRNGATNIWARREQAGFFRRASQEPVQLTVGPMNYHAPVPSEDGKRLFVVGELRRGELARYDTKTNEWGSYLSGISAQHLDFSRDGAWVVYMTYPEGNLWRSKMDGSQRLQLTSPPMQASLPRWSPNGKEIAFTARVPGKGWKTYLIPAEGGTPQQLMQEERTEKDPSWSPDGKKLVFGDDDAKTIRLLDLSTRQAPTLPGSEGLFGPRWSPDGRYIAAHPFALNKLLLFDFTTQKWTELVPQPATWQRWSRDGKYIYFYSQLPDDPALFRVRIGDRKIDRIASTKNFRQTVSIFFGSWFGWAPDDSPLVLRDFGTQDIYALEWQAP